ncbi:MAG: short-chain dehydrogenase/reductase [Bradyrhizobium sp.]|jgi:short-subunit dehydrogenase|nr:short-chain dehydrogenase/reductase [Bradyrhizobium sp.]
MSRRVLITGCSSGIGRALATELSGRGDHVIATARRIETLADLDVADRLALDVTNEASVGAAVERAGPVDILVNNAGFGFWGAVEPAAPDDVQALFDTNVFGMLRMVRAVLPGMRARRSGTILQISSAVAHRSSALLGHYAASKAALEAYSEALRIELAGFGVSVSIVVLGAVESDFGRNRLYADAPDYADLSARVRRRIEANRTAPATAEAVARRIGEALGSGSPPLRIEGSDGADALVAQRRALSDAAWETATLQGLAEAGETVKG